MKKTLACLLALILCVPVPVYAAPGPGADTFADVTEPDMLYAVQFLSSLGFIAPAGTYGPDTVLDKASYCKLVVEYSGVGDIDGFRGYTLFTDVRADHWALPYINAAVRELKIISGRADGTFGPSDPITYGQAATLMVRMLGYSEADVGYNWPRNYIVKAETLGLNKNVGTPEFITRGDAALLFYNLLYAKMKGEDGKEGEPYMSRLTNIQEPVEVVIEDVDGLSPDGSERGIVTTGGDEFYRSQIPMDQSLAGYKGELLATTDGYVLTFKPKELRFKDIDFEEAAGDGVTDEAGDTFEVKPKTAVFENGSETTFSSSWKKMQKGDSMRVFFKSSGAVDYIVWSHYDPATAIVATTESAGAQAIFNAYGVNANKVTVYKNGARTSADAIAKYDTLSYTPGSNSVYVSSVRINMSYPSHPATEEWESISAMGRDFTLSESARAQIEENDYRIGDWVTACLSVDGVVGAVYPTTEVKSSLVGWSLSNSSMETFNGLVFSGAKPSAGIYKGMLVSGSSTINGLSMSASLLNGTGVFSIKDGQVGHYQVAEWCKFFVVSGSFVAPITLDEIYDSVVPLNKVRNITLSTDRKVEILVLEGINNDAMKFGYISIPGDGFDFSSPAILRSSGETYEIWTGTSFLSTGFIGLKGVELEVVNNQLQLVAVHDTHQYTVKRSDIHETDYIMIGKDRVPIAKDCQLRRSSSYLDINTLQQYKNETFEVYCDKPAGESGCKVRQIFMPQED